MINHQDNFGTNLTSGTSASDTTSPLNSIPSIAAPFYIAFDATNINNHYETKLITSKTATNVLHSALSYDHTTAEEVRMVCPAEEMDSWSEAITGSRSATVVSSATPSINTDTTDIFTVTALAAAITSFTTNLTGTPVNGQKLILRIKDDGTARAITWGASFVSRGATLPTTTVLGKYLYVGFIYNSTASVWDCVAVSQEV